MTIRFLQLMVLSIVMSISCLAYSVTETVYVKRVIDGDTIEVILNNESVKVRLIGVDTPETVHPRKKVECYGPEASKYLKEKITNKEIELAYKKNKVGRFGRLLAYIYYNDISINEDLIKKGYAKAYVKYPFALKEKYKKIGARAKASGVGMWGKCE